MTPTGRPLAGGNGPGEPSRSGNGVGNELEIATMQGLRTLLAVEKHADCTPGVGKPSTVPVRPSRLLLYLPRDFTQKRLPIARSGRGRTAPDPGTWSIVRPHAWKMKSVVCRFAATTFFRTMESFASSVTSVSFPT